MTDRMSKQPVIIGANGVQKLNRVSLNKATFNEEWLQNALEQAPSILPTAEIAPIFAPLVCIAREVRLKTDDNNSGRIDNLYISKHGHLVIVETKLWNNPEARREVVGQILDYAKEVKDWDYDKLNAIYRDYNKTKQSLFDAMVAGGYQIPESEADFIDTVNQNIRNAQFLLMIVGDGIRSGVEKIADYMNANPDMHHRLALCELEVYDLGDGRRLIVPQLTTKTKIIERGIIRIENNGNIKVSLTEPENDVGSHRTMSDSTILTQSEWIDIFSSRNKNIGAGQLTSFLAELADWGFNVNFTPRAASVYVNAATMNTDIPVLFMPGKPRQGSQDNSDKIRFAKICFVPIRILRRLETLGYPAEIGKRFFEDLRPFLAAEQKTKPYKDYAKFYYLDDKIITNAKMRKKFLGVLEDFQNNL